MQSQILKAYPTRFIETDGHAQCSLLLYAFKVFTQASSSPNVSSTLHSDYKKHCTAKLLGGCDLIGCTWDQTVTDDNPGKASDAFTTEDTKILRKVPFSHMCKVDKGFIVDNLGVRDGVIIDRPQKQLKKQI